MQCISHYMRCILRYMRCLSHYMQCFRSYMRCFCHYMRHFCNHMQCFRRYMRCFRRCMWWFCHYIWSSFNIICGALFAIIIRGAFVVICGAFFIMRWWFPGVWVRACEKSTPPRLGGKRGAGVWKTRGLVENARVWWKTRGLMWKTREHYFSPKYALSSPKWEGKILLGKLRWILIQHLGLKCNSRSKKKTN